MDFSLESSIYQIDLQLRGKDKSSIIAVTARVSIRKNVEQVELFEKDLFFICSVAYSTTVANRNAAITASFLTTTNTVSTVTNVTTVPRDFYQPNDLKCAYLLALIEDGI